jgi:thiol:disulfide interchange protein
LRHCPLQCRSTGGLWYGPLGLPRWLGWVRLAVTVLGFVLLALIWRDSGQARPTSLLLTCMFGLGSSAILLWDRARSVTRLLRLASLAVAALASILSVRGLLAGG